MPIREISKKDGVLLGWTVRNEEEKRWNMSMQAQTCIKDKMKTHAGLTMNGDVSITHTKGKEAEYIFGFTSDKHKGEITFSIFYNGDAFEIEMEAQAIKDEEVKEVITDRFVQVLKDLCRGKGLGMTRTPSLFYRPGEEPPQKNLYGYAEKKDQDELEKMFGSLSLGKKEGGRTHRSKKQRGTRRRKTNLHNRRR